jgi:hypothetical protein
MSARVLARAPRHLIGTQERDALTATSSAATPRCLPPYGNLTQSHADPHQTAFVRAIARAARHAVEAGRSPSVGKKESAEARLSTDSGFTNGRREDGCDSHPI